MEDLTISDEVRKYMSALGKRGGAVNKARGSEYFKRIREGKKLSEMDLKLGLKDSRLTR